MEIKNYAIVEDQPLSMRQLKDIVSRIRPNAVLRFSAGSISETESFLLSRSEEVDLIFMDIELNDGNCFKMLERIKPTVPIIFTTAYDEYAIRAFRFLSVDYLLKPICEEDVARALDKFENQMSCAPDYLQLAEQVTELSLPQSRKRLLLPTPTGFVHLPVCEIAYFISEDRYVFAVEKKGKSHITDFPNLNYVVSVLCSERFYMLSRGVLANVDNIGKATKMLGGRLKVQLVTEEHTLDVVVSAARKKGFMDWLASI